MRKILRAAWGGINISSVVFLIGCIAVGLDGGAEKFASGYGMARSGITAIIIGIGFGVPTLIYETELPQWLKVLIHMGTGCLVMTGASMLGGCSGGIGLCRLGVLLYLCLERGKEDQSENKREAAGRITALRVLYPPQKSADDEKSVALFFTVNQKQLPKTS